MHLRIEARHLGGHIHCDFFTNQNGPDYTFAKNGTLVFDRREWLDIRDKLMVMTKDFTEHGPFGYTQSDIDAHGIEDRK